VRGERKIDASLIPVDPRGIDLENVAMVKNRLEFSLNPFVTSEQKKKN
jgi:hypothetical protein